MPGLLPFVEFAFPAAGVTALYAHRRTMPDRLADVINVKDWGALGNGSDDRAAIQAAIDFLVTPPRTGGRLFFPPGPYVVNGPLVVGSDYDVGVEFIGSGKENTTIAAGSSYSDPLSYGYVISSGTETYDNLAKISGFTQLNLKGTRDGIIVESCDFSANNVTKIGCNLVEAKNAAIRGCHSDGPPAGNNPPNSASPGPVAGSIAMVIGSGIIAGCRVVGGWYYGYALAGEGGVLMGCSVETCNTGVVVGWGPTGPTTLGSCPARGSVIQGLQTERCRVAIDLYDATGCFINSNAPTAAEGWVGTRATVDGTVSYSGGTVTCNTSAPHFLTTGARIQIGSVGNPTWTPLNINGHPGGNPTAMTMVTVNSSTQFTYPLSVTPSAYNSGDPLTWNYAPEYTMRCRKVHQCVFVCNDFSHVRSGYSSLDLNYGGAADHLNNTIMGAQFSYGVTLPPGAYLASWKFLYCHGDPSFFLDSGVVAVPGGSMVYANLPGESGVVQPRVEGQEFYITDGRKTPGGADDDALWNETVVGGGTHDYLVRYNGAAWKRIG